jgi:hypothetical protein
MQFCVILGGWGMEGMGGLLCVNNFILYSEFILHSAPHHHKRSNYTRVVKTSILYMCVCVCARVCACIDEIESRGLSSLRQGGKRRPDHMLESDGFIINKNLTTLGPAS